MFFRTFECRGVNTGSSWWVLGLSQSVRDALETIAYVFCRHEVVRLAFDSFNFESLVIACLCARVLCRFIPVGVSQIEDARLELCPLFVRVQLIRAISQAVPSSTRTRTVGWSLKHISNSRKLSQACAVVPRSPN
eukprot:4112519-Pleurochrysis_carterae.AAC.2